MASQDKIPFQDVANYLMQSPHFPGFGEQEYDTLKNNLPDKPKKEKIKGKDVNIEFILSNDGCISEVKIFGEEFLPYEQFSYSTMIGKVAEKIAKEYGVNFYTNYHKKIDPAHEEEKEIGTHVDNVVNAQSHLERAVKSEVDRIYSASKK